MSSRIVAVDLLRYSIPLVTPLVTTRGETVRREGFVVRLRSADGSVGIGDAAPHPHDGPDAIAALHAELRHAARWLAGASLERSDELLDAAGRLGRPAAMGVDVALHDLLARARGVALVELLGGRRCAVPASALLGPHAVADARRAAADGYGAAKLKANGDPDALAATVAAITRAAPGLALRIDANGAWSAGAARAALGVLPAAGIEWIEQPVAPADLGALARVRAAAAARGLRVAADEAVTGPDAVRRIVAAGAAHVVVLKLVQVGGLRPALAAAEVAHAAGLAVVVTTAIDTGVGTAAALHLAAALRTGVPPGGAAPAAGVATGALLARDVVREPPAPRACMRLPRGPGLGVALRDDVGDSGRQVASA